LGLIYGIGFCPLTEWHWQVLEKLGYHNLPYSYIKYIIDRLTGSNVNAQLVGILTAVVFSLAIILSVYFNFFWKKRKRREARD